VCKLSRTRWSLIIGFLVWVGLECLEPVACMGQYVSGPSAAPQSSFTTSIKQSFNKLGEFFSPKPKVQKSPLDDPISLQNPGKPSPQLYSAVARLYEESGRYAEAEQYYQKALREKADDLASLLGYARLQENQGRFNEAVALYQRAVQTHPKEPSAYNNLGLCYARRGTLSEAARALNQAVQLEPRSPLYRNNLAAVLVDQNRLAEAFANLREVHGDAAAYYNLGYLLNKKGQTEAAEHHFAQALRIDPTMAPAQRWLTYLHDKSKQSLPSSQTGEGAIRVGSLADPSHFPVRIITPPASPSTNPASSSSLKMPVRLPLPGSATASDAVPDSSAVQSQSDTPPEPPAINLPQRLPSVSLRQPAASTQQLNQTQAPAPPDTTAPLPPGMQ
jgi:Tfp pilus assembly protein PilF